MIDPAFWRNRRVFLTGHTGFKGSWLSLWLHNLGASVTGFSLEPPTTPALFADCALSGLIASDVRGDIREPAAIAAAMQKAAPEIVIHMAAQSLVRDSYADPAGTYATNVLGTVHALEAVRKTPSVKAVLNVTTDKCYENNEWPWGYREIDPMGGHDPYSSSKACAELVTSAYRRSFLKDAGVALASARAGNVIGGGDWARDRLIPDAVRAFMAGEELLVRNPLATRPWQHVLEPLSGYLILCQQLHRERAAFAEGWNFGPRDADVQPVSAVIDHAARFWGDKAGWQLDQGARPHEAHSLKLDCSKASTRLGWRPIWSLDRALRETVAWYKARHERHPDLRAFTNRQIEAYQNERLEP